MGKGQEFPVNWGKYYGTPESIWQQKVVAIFKSTDKFVFVGCNWCHITAKNSAALLSIVSVLIFELFDIFYSKCKNLASIRYFCFACNIWHLMLRKKSPSNVMWVRDGTDLHFFTPHPDTSLHCKTTDTEWVNCTVLIALIYGGIAKMNWRYWFAYVFE